MVRGGFPYTSHLSRHLKTHSGEKSINATNVTLPPFRQAIWGHIWKQMQPMWLCIFSCRRFEGTFENTRWQNDKLEWHIESAKSFEYSNTIYSKGSVDVNFKKVIKLLIMWRNRRQHRYCRLLSLQMGNKRNCVAAFLQFW